MGKRRIKNGKSNRKIIPFIFLQRINNRHFRIRLRCVSRKPMKFKNMSFFFSFIQNKSCFLFLLRTPERRDTCQFSEKNDAFSMCFELITPVITEKITKIQALGEFWPIYCWPHPNSNTQNIHTGKTKLLLFAYILHTKIQEKNKRS